MKHIARRLAFYVAAAWAAITINFFVPRAMPGNAVDAMMAQFPHLEPGALKALEAEFGVGSDGSLLHQYGSYLVNILHGNLGTDLTQFPTPVSSIIASTLPWTLILVGSATVISFLLGTLLGIFAAWRRGSRFDNLMPGFIFLQATPYFFLALLLVDLFAAHLHYFPEQRGYDIGLVPGWHLNFIESALYHSLLPALTIVITSVGGWMLGMRNMMITTLGEDYVLSAVAKGLAPRRIMLAYGARNAILPSFAAFSTSLGLVVSGALIMEVVFAYPGVGLLLYNAVTSNDYPMVQALFLIISLAVLGANLIAEVVYVLVDPRTRTAEAA
jgi:peptide/nickel transport system permease protein